MQRELVPLPSVVHLGENERRGRDYIDNLRFIHLAIAVFSGVIAGFTIFNSYSMEHIPLALFKIMPTIGVLFLLFAFVIVSDLSPMVVQSLLLSGILRLLLW